MKPWSVNPELEKCAEALDDENRTKFLILPQILHDWLQPVGGLRGKRVLDFGCGYGVTAAGIAELGGASLVVGVDINDEAESCEPFLREKLGREGLPQSLVFEEIRPGETTSYADFDCIFSWSVFEHVNNRIFADVLAELVGKMRAGAHFFVQISPLYFSPEGSHLWAIGYGKWDHLVSQTSDIKADLTSAPNVSDAQKNSLWNMFKTLNRITAPDLIERFEMAGLKLVRLQKDHTELVPPHELLRAYGEEALKTFQIVALFTKPDDAST